MARQRKPRYEYVESKQLFRKRVKGKNGTWISLYAKTPDELTSKIEEFEEDLRVFNDNRENPFVTDYADYWIALQEGHLTYGTFEDYKSIINRHIKPPMKGLRMRDVLPDDITRMMKDVANFSKSVHDKTYMLAKQMFTNAYDNKLISENPCPKMHAGGRDPVERQALTNEQMNTLIEAVKGTRAYVFCMISAEHVKSFLGTQEVRARRHCRRARSVSKKRQSRFFEKGCMAEGARFLAKLSPLPP